MMSKKNSRSFVPNWAKYTSFLWAICCFTACQTHSNGTNAPTVLQATASPVSLPKKVEVPVNELINTFTLADFYTNNSELNRVVDTLFNKLSEEERIAQMIMPAIGKLGRPEAEILELIGSNKIGGVLFLPGEATDLKPLVQRLKNKSKQSNNLPLFFTLDAEPGMVNNRIITNIEKIYAQTVANIDKAADVAADISGELKKYGINYNFAPVYDVRQNMEIIGKRSFSSNAQVAADFANAFTQSTQLNGIIATAKHFPGHGNVKGDSHKNKVFINGDLKELPQFESAVAQGVLSVMVGHIIIENNPTFETQGEPASLSKKIVTDLLRQQMGFEGLIITDALNMKGVTFSGDAAYKAFLAGNDIILMPENPKQLIAKINTACKTDALLQAQMHQSVKRILRAKITAQLF